MTRVFLLGLSLVVLMFSPVQARDAAFLAPGSSGGSAISDEAVRVDPKAEVDVGETAVNVAKHTSIFFVNQTNMPIKIEKIVLNSDSNVTAEATANDCTKQGVITPLSRCSVEVSVTPSSPGSWSVDVLMTHNGAGRITRARLVGKTSGSASGENKSTGLAVNVKETKPIDFGEVIVGDGKTVRSTLMINDSSETITIYSIDVIEADNGLQRIDQGCDVDMELPPGASCPVTLLWVPKSNGPVSTDLIIRHSGKLGFAVIPIRGSAKNSKNPEGLADLKDHLLDKDGKKDGIPLPPSQKDLAVLVKLERAITGKVEPLSGASLGHSISEATDSSPAGGDGKLHLIGTVGADRAVLLKPSGETAIVSVAATFDVDEKEGKLLSISARSVDVTIDGKKKTLSLESVKFLVMRATQSTKQDDKDSKGAAGGSNVSGGSTGGGQK